ncbi:MAG: rRNA maturation RNase YbeY [Clostridiaceae bacterium]|jgi:probable rRNA maturation factor|nr:rRNA maturation RNase YbeY [Clostridiaceae bacterium]
MLRIYGAPFKYKHLLKRVYACALAHLKCRDIFFTETNFVPAEEIKEINLRTRGVDAVTDVLSFPAIDMKGFPLSVDDYKTDMSGGKLILGEICICYERLAEQAAEYGHGEKREAAYLFLHGLLHLFGFDHMDDAGKEKMRAAEEAVLNKLGITRV